MIVHHFGHTLFCIEENHAPKSRRKKYLVLTNYCLISAPLQTVVANRTYYTLVSDHLMWNNVEIEHPLVSSPDSP